MTPDRDFIAAMSAGIPPIGTPDPITSDEAEHETENGLFAGPEWAANLPTLSPDEIAEGDARQEHC